MSEKDKYCVILYYVESIKKTKLNLKHRLWKDGYRGWEWGSGETFKDTFANKSWRSNMQAQ